MRAIIIDDESLALSYLTHQLKGIEDVYIIGTFTDPIAGKLAIEDNDIDIVFLDIHMPEVNGIELAEQLLERKPGLYIVFVTAHGDYAVQAFELNALDYILKPISQQRLRKTIQRIHSNAQEASAYPSDQQGKMYVRTCQQFMISVNEQRIPLHWRTAKVEQLFLYFVQHKGQVVNKTTIIELLWPELDSDKGIIYRRVE